MPVKWHQFRARFRNRRQCVGVVPLDVRRRPGRVSARHAVRHQIWLPRSPRPPGAASKCPVRQVAPLGERRGQSGGPSARRVVERGDDLGQRRPVDRRRDLLQACVANQSMRYQRRDDAPAAQLAMGGLVSRRIRGVACACLAPPGGAEGVLEDDAYRERRTISSSRRRRPRGRERGGRRPPDLDSRGDRLLLRRAMRWRPTARTQRRR